MRVVVASGCRGTRREERIALHHRGCAGQNMLGRTIDRVLGEKLPMSRSTDPGSSGEGCVGLLVSGQVLLLL